MKYILLAFMITLSLSACAKHDTENNIRRKQMVNRSIDVHVYNALSKFINEAIRQKMKPDNIDSVSKYLTMNEESEGENLRKLYPETAQDDSSFNLYLDLLIEGAQVNHRYVCYRALLTMETMVLRNVELSEGLNDIIGDFWRKPTFEFIKAVVDIPDNHYVSLNQALPEGRDTLYMIMRKIDAIPNIKKINDYGKVKTFLKNIADVER